MTLLIQLAIDIATGIVNKTISLQIISNITANTSNIRKTPTSIQMTTPLLLLPIAHNRYL